jgi:hypothetical protein
MIKIRRERIARITIMIIIIVITISIYLIIIRNKVPSVCFLPPPPPSFHPPSQVALPLTPYQLCMHAFA